MNARRETQEAPTSLQELLEWPTERVARWVSGGAGPVVAGWPFNGTRRWFLGHRRVRPGDYLPTLVRRGMAETLDRLKAGAEAG